MQFTCENNRILVCELTFFSFLSFWQMMSGMDSRVWFEEVVPGMARLLLRLPSLLEAHYLKSDEMFGEGKAGLRFMGPQEPGLVFLNQVKFFKWSTQRLSVPFGFYSVFLLHCGFFRDVELNGIVCCISYSHFCILIHMVS